jgi:ribonuclease I
MKQEGLDMTTHGFWPQDEERVREENIPDIRPRRRTPGDVHAQLHHALSGMGLRNIDIQIEPSMHGQDTTTMRIRHSRRQEIDNYQGNSV